MKKIITFINFAVIFSSISLFLACAETTPPTLTGETKNKIADAPLVRVSSPEAEAAEPVVAAGADGAIYVIWVEHGAGKPADVFLQKFDAEAKPAGEKTRVNSVAGQATAWRGDPPSLAIGADGAIYVGWTANVKNDAGSGTDLHVSVSRDGGKSFAPPVKVNDDDAPASHGMHSLAVDKTGKIFVAWLDERNVKMPAHASIPTNETALPGGFRFVKAHHTPEPEAKQTPKPETKQSSTMQHAPEANSEIFYAISTDGGKSFSPNKKIAAEICPCCKTSLAVAPDGKIHIGWRQVLPGDFRHIAVATSADGGETFSAPIVVSDDKWEINACPVSGPALAVGGGNALEVVWFSAGQAGAPGLYRAVSIDGGRTFSPRAIISENAISGAPSLYSNAGGKIGQVWESDGKIFRLRQNQNDERKSEEIGDGAFPSAVFANGKIFVGFVKKDADKRGVWLKTAGDF